METNVKHVYVFMSPSNGQWYWRARAENGEIVAQGESHPFKSDAVRAAEGVFPGFEVQDAKE
jgi:uncharacterized protein YegP (UPF0339 family)